ncbi:MAG: hypothetical protein WA708_17050 [Acidobacteriaceae bacterium]
MNRRKIFNFMAAGAAVLGLALCVPSAMLAQSTTPPDSSGMNGGQSNSQGNTEMQHRRRPSAKRQLQRLTKMLNLTDSQQQQMLPILQDQQTQMESIRNNTSLSPQQRREQMRTLMMDTHQKLEALMTDSQKQQFEQAMQQRHDRMREHRMGQGPGSAPGGTPPPPDGQNPPPPPPPQL